MARNSSDTEPTAGPKKAVTPPKGRPTRPRDGELPRKRAFGPVAQWITVALLVVLAVAALILITDGGDFNPFNDEPAPSEFGAPAVVAPN
jgi:hypothetical protein